MTLTDAGPLVALIDADEPDHDACLEALESLSLPLVTTWPAFTEAMYLVVRAGGAPGHRALWRLIDSRRLEIAELSADAVKRSERLMDQYADTPMDLADATLVALAEEIRQRRIFTLDDDFDVYRLHGRQRFERVPAP
ncbi:MAG TPA: PIN domain nuclease [Candidatus Dormibacteraeota bacterium]|nr:PIN domain nuclease [Candidatus Dormibacteraeota bacterium]